MASVWLTIGRYGTLLGTQFFQVRQCISLSFVDPSLMKCKELCWRNHFLQSTPTTTILPTSAKTVPSVFWIANCPPSHIGLDISWSEDLVWHSVFGAAGDHGRSQQMECIDSNSNHLCFGSYKYGLYWSCNYKDYEREETPRQAFNVAVVEQS